MFEFERTPLPRFEGTLREYPPLKFYWINPVVVAFSEKDQLMNLCNLVRKTGLYLSLCAGNGWN